MRERCTLSDDVRRMPDSTSKWQERYRTDPVSRRGIGHDGQFGAPLAHPGQSRASRPSARRSPRCTRRIGSTMPNEVMPPHKHSPSAIRFGLRQGKFHRRRWREHRVRPGRHGAHAERHLAQSRQRRRTSRRSICRCSICRWSRRSTRSISSTITPRWTTASRSRRSSRPRRVPSDYSAAHLRPRRVDAALRPARPRRRHLLADVSSIAGR